MKDHLKNVYMQIQCDLEDHLEEKPKSYEGMIKLSIEKDSLGWIKIEILQQYVEEFDGFPSEATVMLYSEDDPTTIYNHELFQRRKVEGNTVVGPEKSFHLLVSGQKLKNLKEEYIMT